MSRAKLNTRVHSQSEVHEVQNESNTVNETQSVMCEIPLPDSVNVQQQECVPDDEMISNLNSNTGYLCAHNKIALTHKVRSVGTRSHVLGVSKGMQTSADYSTKSCQFNFTPDSSSIAINVKPDCRNVGSQILSTLPIDIDSIETKCTQSSSINSLLENGTFCDFIQKLDDSKQTNDFKALVEAIASHSLPTSNMAWKSALYRGKWEMLESTHQMQFDPEYFEYWAIMNIMFGCSMMNVMRGPGHFGKVVLDRSCRNKYEPSQGKCNFAIPSSRTLSKLDVGYGKFIPSGLIQQIIGYATGTSTKRKETVHFEL